MPQLAKVTRRRRLEAAALELWAHPSLAPARRKLAGWLRAPAQFLDPQPVVEYTPETRYRIRFPLRPPLPGTFPPG